MKDNARIRKEIKEIISKIERPGINDLVKFLDTSDYYTAPCSTKFHLACVGGLAEHSLNVYKLLHNRYLTYLTETIYEDTIRICGLFHDLCKVNFYKDGGDPATKAQEKYLSTWYNFPEKDFLSKKYASILIEHFKGGGKVSNIPKKETEWVVEDKLPLGHGEKSVIMLQNYIKLNEDEQLAIRWHMTAFDASIHFDYPNGFAFREASKRKLVTLLFTADYEASQVVEG